MTKIRFGLLLLLTVTASLSLANVGLAKEKTAFKTKSSSIQIILIDSKEINLPAEFQIALYENLIDQIQKSGKFQHVYRDGDRDAAGASDLIVLRGTVQGFKQGSERERQVTTVTGETAIDVHCQITDKAGKSLLEQDITGKVRFFGGNLRATYDFAKKVAQLVNQPS